MKIDSVRLLVFGEQEPLESNQESRNQAKFPPLNDHDDSESCHCLKIDSVDWDPLYLVNRNHLNQIRNLEIKPRCYINF